MDMQWITSYLIIIALFTAGLVEVEGKKKSLKNSTLKLLKSIYDRAPCKGGKCVDARDPRGAQERYVISDLLMTYDKLARPVTKDSQNVTVHFSASLQELLDHAEGTGRVGMRMNLRMWWNDPNLRWPPKDYGGVDKVSLPASHVWVPDITLYNGWLGQSYVGSVDNKVKNDVRLRIYSNGDVLWMPPAEFQVTCTYQFRTDSWSCPLVFRSLSYDASQMDIVPFRGKTELGMDELAYSANWRIIESTGEKTMTKYPCCDDEIYPTLKYMIGVRMKIGHPALGKRSVPFPFRE